MCQPGFGLGSHAGPHSCGLSRSERRPEGDTSLPTFGLATFAAAAASGRFTIASKWRTSATQPCSPGSLVGELQPAYYVGIHKQTHKLSSQVPSFIYNALTPRALYLIYMVSFRHWRWNPSSCWLPTPATTRLCEVIRDMGSFNRLAESQM